MHTMHFGHCKPNGTPGLSPALLFAAGGGHGQREDGRYADGRRESYGTDNV